jgi:hypothetical protein
MEFDNLKMQMYTDPCWERKNDQIRPDPATLICLLIRVSELDWIRIQSGQWIRIRILEGKNDKIILKVRNFTF